MVTLGSVYEHKITLMRVKIMYIQGDIAFVVFVKDENTGRIPLDTLEKKYRKV